MDLNNITFDLPKDKSAAIKVIGVGGGGSNAVNYMFEGGITGVDFVVCNTDAQALNNSAIPYKIQLGASITEGLGAGANPEVGEQAALESLDDIKNLLDTNTKMVFITAGMGGGTGTGAAPIIANCAKEMGILTIGIVTAPFYFEGKMRLEQAKKGIEKLRNHVDSLIIINNDKLRELYGNLGYKTGFAKADEVLATAAKGIAEVITHHYTTNIDLRDAKTVLADSGTAIMGSAKAKGDDKAKKCIELALDSPLLNDNKITGAKNVLLLILSGNEEITIDEIGVINEHIQQEAGNNANIIMGIGEDESLDDGISVTIIATGFPMDQQAYTGKEEQVKVHRLEEEQPLTKTLSVEKPKTEEENQPIQKIGLDAPLHESQLNPDLDETVIEADLKFELKSTAELEQPIEEEANIEDNETTFELDIEESIDSELEETEDEITSNDSGFTLFSLDDDWNEAEEAPQINNTSEENFSDTPPNNNTPQASTSIQPEEKSTIIEEEWEQPIQEKQPVEEEEEPFSKPIPEAINQQIEERRERLKKFNFKFKNSLKDIDEAEQTPAYERKGIELNEHKKERPSRYIIDEDVANEVKIRPNNFLNDNVD